MKANTGGGEAPILFRDKATQVCVKALFLDYDGTISPLDAVLSESAVPTETAAVLRQISAQIPTAAISTKDIAFLTQRTPYFHAWSGMGGLETKIGNSTHKAECLQTLVPQMKTALDHAKRSGGNGVTVEEKHDSEGNVVAFSVDWRHAADKSEAENRVLRVLDYCRTLPLVTLSYEGKPFFDVFPCAIDKGKALLYLKKKLKLTEGVLYMGDSYVDNPAFAEADLSIGVVDEEPLLELTCDYFVKFREVSAFLKMLLYNGLFFSPKFSMLLKSHGSAH
jgi:trehalose-phosphatase